MKKYKRYDKYKKMLTSVCNPHKNKDRSNRKNYKRVISIAQLCLSAELQ